MQFFIQSNNNSRASSRPSSRTGSRAHSRNQSRNRHANDDDDDYGVPTIDLFVPEMGTKEWVDQPEPKSLEILNEDRTKSSSSAREEAMSRLIYAVTRKFEPVTETAFEVCCKALNEAKSDQEILLGLNLLAVVVGSDTDFVTDIPQQIMTKIWNMANSDSYKPKLRSHLIFGSSILKYFRMAGSGAYDLDEVVDKYFELASSTTDSSVAASAYYGAGLLLSTVPEKGRNTTLYNICEQASTTLSLAGQDHDVVLPLAEIVALCYQLWDYEEDNSGPINGGPRDFIASIESGGAIRGFNSSRDKRGHKSILRDVVRSVELFSDAKARENLTADDLVISHLTVPVYRSSSRTTGNVSKHMPIDSWSKLFLVKHLKWLYEDDVYTQIVSNPHVKELFISTNNGIGSEHRDKVMEEPFPEEDVDERVQRQQASAQERSRQINHDRDVKMQLNGQILS